MEATTMTSFLATIGEFFTQSLSWVGDLMDTIISSPALTIVVFGTMIVGFVFGLVGRLFSVR